MRNTLELIAATDRLARQLSQIAGAARQMGKAERAQALQAMAELLATVNRMPLAASAQQPPLAEASARAVH